MANILEINNWNQLVRARSDCENLRIVVSQYNNNPNMTGTKIQIVDYNTNDIYLTLFTEITSSTLIPLTASLELNQIVDIVNLYGFNIRISEPKVLSENVLTILRGLYASGYRYIYKDYVKGHVCDPNDTPTEYRIYTSVEILLRRADPCVSRMPSFVPDEWDWVEAFKTYPIQRLIEDRYVDNGLPIESLSEQSK